MRAAKKVMQWFMVEQIPRLVDDLSDLSISNIRELRNNRLQQEKGKTRKRFSWQVGEIKTPTTDKLVAVVVVGETTALEEDTCFGYVVRRA